MLCTFPPRYLDLEFFKAPQRLATLRANSRDWRTARRWTLKNARDAHGAGWHLGSNGTGRHARPVYYSHTSDGSIARIVDAADILRDASDRGDVRRRLVDDCEWTTGMDGDETAIGIVARLSHGRFLAGYRWTANGERALFADEVFTDEVDAAKMAGEHARVFADSERADAERFQSMVDIESRIEDTLDELRRAFALRNHPRLGVGERKALRIAVATVRDLRETLETDYADFR